jgi:hypothetical protein
VLFSVALTGGSLPGRLRAMSEPPADARADEPGATAVWKPLLLAALSVLATLAAVECGMRLVAGDPLGRPDPGGAIRMVGTKYPGAHDARLGWVPQPGEHPDNAWGTRVTITAAGTRSNGAPPPPGRPVVAVGDSFTFGDEVDDADTWPAQLERALGVPVVNGGVFGYGLDQIALRAEELLAQGEASALVVSIVPNDVLRCEYAYRYAWKPWFTVKDGALVLEGVPVPGPDRAPPGEPLPRRWLRASFLADALYRRLDPEDWLLPDSLRVHRRGVEVGALLMDRLAALAREHQVPLLFAVSWYPRAVPAAARPVMARARELGIELLDLEPTLRAALGPGGARAGDLYRIHAKPGQPVEIGHMTARGNAVVAGAIAERLRAMGVGPRE